MRRLAELTGRKSLLLALLLLLLLAVPAAFAATIGNTSPPTISGPNPPVVGQALTVSNGTWNTTKALTYTRQWARCPAASWNASTNTCNSWANISGATAQSYTPVSADLGLHLRAQVTAKEGKNSGTAYSAPTAAVTSAPTNAPPANTAAPVISGTAKAGQTLTTTTGTWSNSPTAYAYQWQGSADAAAWTNISGATASSYVVQAQDVDRYLRSVVTATNAYGSSAASSTATAKVQGIAPAAGTVAISGTAQQGQLLTATAASFSLGVPAGTYVFKWYRCTNATDTPGGATCATVVRTSSAQAANSDPYTPAAADVNFYLKVVATVTNTCTSGCGAASATSAATAKIVAGATAPTNTTAPVVSGTAKAGQTLTSSTGTWSGTTPITYAYQWQTSPNGTSWTNLSGATASSYVVQAPDVNQYLRAVVTATNTVGSSAASSAATPVVQGIAPSSGTVALSGTATAGQTLTATASGFTLGTPASTYVYKWYRCANATDTPGSGSCATLLRTSVATTATTDPYTLASSDVDAYVKVVATASNSCTSGCGAASATSAASARVQGLAPTAGTVAISGLAQQAQTLTATASSFTLGTPAGSYVFKWYRCTNATDTPGSGTCATLLRTSAASAANNDTYTVQSADVNFYLKVVATVTNTCTSGCGSATATSPATAKVTPLPPPANTAPPVISGLAQEGQVLTTSTGTWTGSSISYAYQWQRSLDGGATWVNISGATSSSYTIPADDVGFMLRSVVTATNSGGSASSSSVATDAVLAAKPVNTAPPVISGTAQAGQTLTTSNGAWTATRQDLYPLSYSYQWQTSADGASFADVAGATGATYTLADSDVNQYLRVIVTATNAGGSTSATSAKTAKVTTSPPVNTAPPAFPNPPQKDQFLTASNGSWTGSPSTFTYQWQRSTDDGATWSDILMGSGYDTAIYKLVAADVSNRVRIRVTATNVAGSTQAYSDASDIVLPAPPQSRASVSTPSQTIEGQIFVAVHGSWTSTRPDLYPVTFSYQWQRSLNGTGWFDIAGATEQNYTIAADDVGWKIRVIEIATNSGGSSSDSSQATATITPKAPVSQSPPSISGTATAGQTLTAETGSWTSTRQDLYPITFSYQWARCPSASTCAQDSDWEVIEGAIDSTYLLLSTDVGYRIRVTEVARNYDNMVAEANSQVVGPVTPGPNTPPVNTALPAVSGTAKQGQLLTTTTGTWTSASSPIQSYAYQWRRCDAAGGSCTNIAGANDVTYIVQAADVNATLRAQVTATNATASASAASVQTAKVTALSGQAPANTAPPTVSGTARENLLLTAAPGSWSGSPSFAYQWQRCDKSGAACASLAGKTSSTYTATTADIGSRLRALVKGSNSKGLAWAATAVTARVVPAPPVLVTAPKIPNQATEGQVITPTSGDWAASRQDIYPITYTYQWQRATGGQFFSIPGATDRLYTIAPEDVGNRVKVLVTAWNGGGPSAAVNSNIMATIWGGAPAPTSPPVISGLPQVGATLTASTGTWVGSATITYSFQWLRCNNGGQACVAIQGATDANYTVQADDEGYTIRVQVTATNDYGSGRATSDQTAVVTSGAPMNSAPPEISGEAREGETLTTSTGTWSGADLTYTYQWQRSEDGATWVNISGATSSSYTIPADDVGFMLRSVVTATNSGGSASSSSAATDAVLAAKPVNTAPPVISGDAELGKTLHTTNGDWTSSVSVSYAYQWQRCDAGGDNCVDIAGATSADYQLVNADVGQTLRARVTATNSGGSTSATSAPSDVIATLDFDIVGSAVDELYPGSADAAIELVITNPYDTTLVVTNVTTTVAGTSDGDCATSNFQITQQFSTTVHIPANSTRSLSDLGVPESAWPKIRMLETGQDQDACQGATLDLEHQAGGEG